MRREPGGRASFVAGSCAVSPRPGVEPTRTDPILDAGRNQLAGVEAGSLGHRHQAALGARVRELGAVRAQDALFDLLAAAFPLRDPSGANFALDCSPDTPCPLGVTVFCGDDSKLGRGKHYAPTVTEAQGEIETAECVTFGGIEISALALELGGIGELSALPPCPANLVGDGGALERELDRAREIALSVGLLREVSEYLCLTARQAELPECTE